MSCQLNRAVAAFLVTMTKRARNRLNILFEDASASRLIGRGFHIEWCASRRPCKRGDCNGPYEVVNNEVADWFDPLVEATRYLLLCLYVHGQADGSWG
jgi:hypothetical protein